MTPPTVRKRAAAPKSKASPKGKIAKMANAVKRGAVKTNVGRMVKAGTVAKAMKGKRR